TFSKPASADTGQIATAPIHTSNRIPFITIHGLTPARSAYLLPQGRTEASLHANAANTSIVDGAGPRRTVIDGETHRLELDVRRGIANDWEIGVNLPVLRHSGGFLDRPIEEWHEVFGLPNGNRDRLPRNRLLFSQRGANGSGFLLDDSGGGIGDLQVSLSRQLNDGLALRNTLKLPTGDGDRLTGSGAAALSTSLHASGRFRTRLHWHASGGLLLSGSSDVLGKQAKSTLAFGSTTLAWEVSDALVLKAQLDAHTAAYGGTGEPLNRATFQLSLGAAFAIADGWALDIGFSEDIAVETAPDIGFHAGLKHRF
ncbi:MAG: DUF3187 family protein, partial [Chromatocurvus sp.]